MSGEKRSVYLPTAMLEELELHAARLERSVSWVIQKAWELARERLAQYPSAPVRER